MIRRTFSARYVNGLVNAPGIRPFVGGVGSLDASTLLADRRNVCLRSEAGGMLFRWSGLGVFDCHIFMQRRGRPALLAAQAMLAEMGRRFGALMVWAHVPLTNRACRWFARQAGMTSRGTMLDPWPGERFEMRF